jgi:hypothetical protein
VGAQNLAGDRVGISLTTSKLGSAGSFSEIPVGLDGAGTEVFFYDDLRVDVNATPSGDFLHFVSHFVWPASVRRARSTR